MKIRFTVATLAVVLAFSAACRKKEAAPASGPPPPPEFGSSENNLGYLNEGIRKFKESKGRLPVQLDELVGEKIIARIPTAPPGFGFVIDAKSGLVILQPQPGAK